MATMRNFYNNMTPFYEAIAQVLATIGTISIVLLAMNHSLNFGYELGGTLYLATH